MLQSSPDFVTHLGLFQAVFFFENSCVRNIKQKKNNDPCLLIAFYSKSILIDLRNCLKRVELDRYTN